MEISLDDLNNDLARVDAHYGEGGSLAADQEYPSIAVARRVASLFWNCPDCHTGPFRLVWATPEGTVPCPGCGGSGVELSEKGDAVLDDITEAWALARYLFGGKP